MKKLVLNKEVFSVNQITAAKIAYKDIADIKISSKKNYFVVNFFKCKYDEERTIREFENYLIGLENMQL